MNKIFYKLVKFSISVFFILTLVFGRSFMGIYLFKFRIGEYLVAFSLFLFMLTILYLKISNFKKYKIFYHILISLFFSFIFFAIIKNDSFLNSYVYQASMYVWTVSFISLGLWISKYVNFNKYFILILNFVLVFTYQLSVIHYPVFLIKLFTKYSDKFEFLKASELGILFIIVMCINKKYFRKDINYTLFLVYFALFLPLFLVKSRGAALAIVTFFIIENFYFLKINNKISIKTYLFSFLIALPIFYLSSFAIARDQINNDENINLIVQGILETKNTNIDNLSSFYISNKRIFSTDANINWRLQIWQDAINFSYNGFVWIDDKYVKLDDFKGYEFLIGSSYSDRIPIMKNPLYQGYDQSNQNVHNFLINIYSRGGLIHLILILFLYYKIIKIEIDLKNNLEIFKFLIPIFIISFFDSSLESPSFSFLFYFFIGFFISKIDKLDENKEIL